ncbi:MAG: transketolase [Rhodospirillaceae bacterium]|nr:transketolase [Rhodospirillaceae bacterium]MBT4589374.1 transketolase [Rhodospirillaceae bacterium]MBT4940938.1 transketolase [Rhodospirillaceae bacterium]MBT7265443.1 transketolase [Rhodospirillaceae bacterium]
MPRDSHANETIDFALLEELENKVRWLASWTIHNANFNRDKPDGLKVGGHQASCASLATIMTALYFHTLNSDDRVAVKPHASPVFHAIQYLFGHQTLEKLQNFRGFGGAQSYPSRTKDIDDVDFSTGSVGLGVAITAFTSLIQDYIKVRDWDTSADEGRMIALVGDAELDEGNIYECLLEGWKHGLRNTWWVIDYNRQSLDGIIKEGLYDRIEEIFKAFGWDVVTLKHGRLQKEAFKKPGGQALLQWIDDCPNQLYSALMFQGADAWREQIEKDIGRKKDVRGLINSYSDDELEALMANLGGHCLPTIIDEFSKIDHDRPVCFIAYTVKGWGLPLAGHKDNHAGIMTPEQIIELRDSHKIREGHEWEPYEGLGKLEAKVKNLVETAPFNARGRRRYQAETIPIDAMPKIPGATLSTQEGFGKILNEIGRTESEMAKRIVTMSPDVTVSTNVGPWVNRKNLFAREKRSDVFQQEQVVSGQKWVFEPEGQHIELGIAESNLFLLLGAAGLSHSLFNERLLPIGTLYDPFIARGLDSLNYACYQDARFMVVATPSGITLAPEGGAHQSIGTPLIGMAQDGLASFEPAFVDELAVIMGWGFEYMQRDSETVVEPSGWVRDRSGGSVYLRCSTRPLDQPHREITPELAKNIVDGAYWLREPGPNCELVIAYQGAVAPEAIAATGLLAEDRKDIGLLAITSADRLNAGWKSASSQRANGFADAHCHIENLLSGVQNAATIITVHDAHPAALSWLAGVSGHRLIPLGVEHFGQTGTVDDLYRHFEIDTQAIVSAAHSIPQARPVRYK